MKLSSSQLEAFYAVARMGSFTKAAQSVNVSQSALSQRILNLETDIETTLFIRDRAGITLTDAARELLRYCELQEQFEGEFLGRIKAKDSSQIAGVIRIAGFSSVMRSAILPTLKDILAKNPQLRLQIFTRELRELLPMLKSSEVDFIVLDEKIERDEIESHKLGVERNVLVESAKVSAPEIYLDHDENDETTLRYLKLAKIPSKNLARHYLDDVYGIIDGVKLGLGKAVLPTHLVADQKDIRIKRADVSLDSSVMLHHYKQPFYSKLHQEVVTQLTRNVPLLLK